MNHFAEAPFFLYLIKDVQSTRPTDEKHLRRLQRSFDHFVRDTMKSLESQYSTIVVPQLLNLLATGYEFDQTSLESIAIVALSVQTLSASIEQTRGILKTYHTQFAQDLEKNELDLTSRMASGQESIEAFKHVRGQGKLRFGLL